MSAIRSIQNLVSGAFVRAAESAPSGLKPYAAVDTAGRSDALRARSRLLKLYRNLESLADNASVKTRAKLDLPDARSTTALSLDLTHTAATLASSDEINASPMSFTPFGPDWADGSSALITIGGEYDGTHGSGTLLFEVRRAGTRGVNNLRIRVEDPQGNRIRNVNIRNNHALDRQYDLRNGLYLTLGAGNLINRDTTTIQVSDIVGAAVNPANPLGGTRNQDPNLQFGGPSVIDGSFTLNGSNIAVATSDSINDVIDRINLSGAGVTANFNSLTERIEFLQGTLGSQPTIDLASDTSNFLAATKLDSVNTVAGIDPETMQSFDSVATFSGVQSGDLRINGQSIAIDTSTDNLQSTIDKINASDAGVVASFDTLTQEFLIESRDPDSRLVIDGNGTGLFAALNLPEGRVDPQAIARGISRVRSYRIADSFTNVFDDINYLFRDASFSGNAGQYRAPLEIAVRNAFNGGLPSEFFGLAFDDSSVARGRGRFATIDRRDLTENLQLRGDGLIDLLSGSEKRRGLLEELMQGTRQALRLVNAELGRGGSVIDTYA